MPTEAATICPTAKQNDTIRRNGVLKVGAHISIDRKFGSGTMTNNPKITSGKLEESDI